MLNPGQMLFMNSVEWGYYEYLREVAPKNWKITYAYGDLYVVAPSRLHERHKCRLGVLIGMALFQLEIDAWEDGSTTLKIPDELGGEPDTSFCIGEDVEYPHLIVESEVTSKLTSGKLELYLRLGVQELWRVDEVGKIVLMKNVDGRWIEDIVSSLVPVKLELFESLMGREYSDTVARKELSARLWDSLTRYV